MTGRGLGLALWFVIPTAILSSQGAAPAAPRTNIPYADAAPIVDVLREDLWPAELRAKSRAEIETGWPQWVSRRDAAVRARVQEGDDDSIINLLLFGTTFTRQPRVTENQLAGLLVRQAGTGATAFVPSPLLRARIGDFETALLSPGANERLQFARQVIERRGMNPSTEAGRATLRQYLEQRTSVVGSAVHSAALLDPSTALVDQLTLFKDRGLASDTAILIDYAIERALDETREEGLLKPGTVRRVAIVGPGLDFADKQEGYDFYPQQTIQPFALVDSLIRLGLASREGVQVTAFDLSPRVLQHLEAARERATSGASYSLVLPRKLDQAWSPEVLAYWERFGDQIGTSTKVAPPPSSAGPVTARGVLVRPSVTLSLHPRDLNIVVQRVEPAAEDQFDLVLATNILLYYDVFEQSLAMTNILRMLRPGGVFLSNDRVFELPSSALGAVGFTDVTYMQAAGTGGKGDRITWYQRR